MWEMVKEGAPFNAMSSFGSDDDAVPDAPDEVPLAPIAGKKASPHVLAQIRKSQQGGK